MFHSRRRATQTICLRAARAARGRVSRDRAHGKRVPMLHRSRPYRYACGRAPVLLLALTALCAACKSSPSHEPPAPTPLYAGTAQAGPAAGTLLDTAVPLCTAASAAPVTPGTLMGPVLFLP